MSNPGSSSAVAEALLKNENNGRCPVEKTIHGLR
jgi:hypothetical protein